MSDDGHWYCKKCGPQYFFHRPQELECCKCTSTANETDLQQQLDACKAENDRLRFVVRQVYDRACKMCRMDNGWVQDTLVNFVEKAPGGDDE